MTQIGTVTGQEIKTNRDGSIAVRLLQVQISNESDIQTVQYMGAAGDDSAPINGDKVQILSIGPAFKFAIAVEDQNNAASMNAGEKKLYSRDGAGAIAAFINFLVGGNLELNGNADFAVRFTNLESMVTSLNSKYDAHTHPDPVSGSTGTPSNAPLGLDISGAKVDEVLLP
jgi:phage gp45-like